MTSATRRSISKAGCVALMITACSSSHTLAFQSSTQIARGATPFYSPHTSALFATGGKGFGSSSSSSNNDSGNNNNKKRGKKPKYTIEDKSYGSSASSASSSSSSFTEIVNNQTPEEFFTTYSEWMPLFQKYQQHSLAHSFLNNNDDNNQPSTNDDTLWGISTLENRNPWRLLPSKPESPTPLGHLGTFLDEWQRSLLDIPIDTLTKEEDIGKGNNDLHFLEEGRRVIAVTRFHVLDGEDYNNDNGVWETELFRTCWSEMGKLMSEDLQDTGSLVVLPNINNPTVSLEYVQQFVQTKLVQPVSWMGRQEDWEIVAMERGSLAVRLLYKLSDIPDLSEKYSPPEEEDE